MRVPASFKHFKFRDRPVSGSVPRLLFGVRLDIRDLRSGLSEARELWLAAPPLPEAELDWTEDLVESLEPDFLEEVPAPREVTWPAAADDQIVRYLGRHHRLRIWRNPHYGLYSRPGQEAEAFVREALGTLGTEEREALEQAFERFLYRFLDLEHRWTTEIQGDETWAGGERERRLADLRELSTRIREQVSRCLLELERDPSRDFVFPAPPVPDVELRERFENLRSELMLQVTELLERHRRRASEIEPYDVPINPGAVEIVERAFLWG
ncbi:MAG: hypothetical protein Kow00109_21090 [Acidobacteriota bacterium]